MQQSTHHSHVKSNAMKMMKTFDSPEKVVSCHCVSSNGDHIAKQSKRMSFSKPHVVGDQS